MGTLVQTSVNRAPAACYVAAAPLDLPNSHSGWTMPTERSKYSMRSAIFVGQLLVLATACTPSRASGCLAAEPSGGWELSARDSRGGHLEADVLLSDSAHVKGAEYHAEGANEPLDFPIAARSWTADSLRFSFAPAELNVRAACGTADSLSVRVSQTYLGKETDPYLGYLRKLRPH
jgi:hypothetical protein